MVKFQREVEQKASHIGGAACQVAAVAPAQPSYYEAGNKLACPLGGRKNREGGQLTPGTYAATPDCFTATADLAATQQKHSACCNTHTQRSWGRVGGVARPDDSPETIQENTC